MAIYGIYSKETHNLIYSGTPKYVGSFLKPSYIEFSKIQSPTPIDWEVGDYVVYKDNIRYKLYSIPQPTIQARVGEHGEAYVYNQVQFYAPTKELEICPFLDLVLEDNDIHFTTMPDVSTYENIYGIRDRIQANLDNLYGTGTWDVQVYPDLQFVNTVEHTTLKEIYATPFAFSVSNGKIIDALNTIYTTWKYNNVGIGWVYELINGVNTIIIGRPTLQESENTTSPFLYGKGKGLKVIKKSISSNNEIATRLYVYGSTRNIPARYYNGKDIKDSDSVYIPNLMLPISTWGQTNGLPDPSKAYIESAEGIAQWGIRPKTIFFDGQNDFEAIYPSIEGVTIDDIRSGLLEMGSTEYYPDGDRYDGEQRVDYIISDTEIDDDGKLSENGMRIEDEALVNSGPAETFVPTKSQSEYRTFCYEATMPFPCSGSLSIPDNQFVIHNRNNEEWHFYVITEIIVNNRVVSKKEENLTISSGGTYNYGGRTISFKSDEVGIVRVRFSIGVMEVDKIATTAQWKFIKIIPEKFNLTLLQIGFNIASYRSALDNGYCTIAMKDGMCGGRSFVLAEPPVYNMETDDWTLTCYRQYDKTLGQYFPNSIYPLRSGDHFVILDIEMPELYVHIAEQRLLARANELADYYIEQKNIYSPEIDNIQMQRWADDPNTARTLKEGMYFAISETNDVADSKYVLIDNITIDESQQIPSYSITLRDDKIIRNSTTSGIGLQLDMTSSAMPSNEVTETTGEAGGTTRHNNLLNRELPDQHPIDAITGLENALSDINEHIQPATTTKPGIVKVGFGLEMQNGAIGVEIDEQGGLGELTHGLGITQVEMSKISGINTALAGKANKTHTHSMNDIEELQAAFDDVDSEIELVRQYAESELAKKPTLDANNLIPTSYLPSYVDDVLEFASKSAFPATGESGKIYVSINDNKTYRWGSSAYVEISASLALGETADTAYAGNKGKALAQSVAALEEGKANKIHIHSEYINEIQFEEALAEKADANNVYTKAQVDAAISSATPDIPIASATTAGLVKVGNLLAINSQGVLNVALDGQGGLTNAGQGIGIDYVLKEQVVDLEQDLAELSETDAGIIEDISIINSTLNNKVDKVSGKGLSTNDYTTAEKNKLSGIASGAEVNVQSDWNATSGDAFIKNKPTTLSGYGITDAKISNGSITLGANTITPLTQHQSLAGYATEQWVLDKSYLTEQSLIHYSTKDNTIKSLSISGTTITYTKGDNSTGTLATQDTWRPLGTDANSACAGNDVRLSNARPASDVSAWAKATTKPTYGIDEITDLSWELDTIGQDISDILGSLSNKSDVGHTHTAAQVGLGNVTNLAASGYFTNLSNSGKNISITIGGTTKTLQVGYATKAGSIDGSISANGGTCTGINTIALGVNSLAGVSSGDNAYPYITWKSYAPLNITYNGSTVKGISLPAGATVSYTYNGTAYSVNNPSAAVQGFALVADDGLLAASTGHPKSMVNYITAKGASLSNVSAVVSVVSGVKGIRLMYGDYNAFTELITLSLAAKSNSSSMSGAYSGAFGRNSITAGDYAMNLGAYTVAANTYSAALGYYSNASGSGAIAIGRNATATNNNAIACGFGNGASGTASVTIGSNNTALNTYAVAIGNYATATHTGGTAIGYYAKAAYNYSIAIGNHAEALFHNVTSIGYYTQGSTQGQVVMGKYNAASSAAFVLGWGTADNARANIFTVSQAGVVSCSDVKLGTDNKTLSQYLALIGATTLNLISSTIPQGTNLTPAQAAPFTPTNFNDMLDDKYPRLWINHNGRKVSLGLCAAIRTGTNYGQVIYGGGDVLQLGYSFTLYISYTANGFTISISDSI